jgi:predicted PurR-regulated permease PerM
MGLFLGPTLLAVAYSLISDWIGVPQTHTEQDPES